jgi:hypothetical protein
MTALPAVLDDPVLLTIDEARSAVVRSSLRCLTDAACNPVGRVAMLWGLPAGPTWTTSDARLAGMQRQVLDAVAACGHDWVIPYELEGILSATGLDEGEFWGPDALAALANVGRSFDGDEADVACDGDAAWATSTAAGGDPPAADTAAAFAWRTRRRARRA